METTETRILFTGIGRRIELLQVFRNAAIVLDKNLRIFGADADEDATAFSFCDYTRNTVVMDDPDYINKLVAICRDDQIDLVIPVTDSDLQVLSENRERFEEIGTMVMITTPNKVHICLDEQETFEFFKECGLQGYIPSHEVINHSGIAGEEYTIDAFCDWDGNLISVVPRARLQVRTGEVSKTKITQDPRMIRETETICKHFRPYGAMTVHLIRSEKTGEDFFTELSPRFGDGAPLSMIAGARSAEIVLRLLDGERVTRCTEIADGAIYCRFDRSVCITEGTGKTSGVIFDLDDTLYSEKEYIRSGFRAVAEWLGDEGCAKTLWHYFEEGKPAIDCLMNDLGRERDSKEAVSIYRNHDPDIHLYEGVEELLQSLRDRGMMLGIITDGSQERQNKKIKALGLENMFDDIIVTDSLGGLQFRKPCSIAFRIMQTRWKLPASEIVYIGDNPMKDFQAPQQVGMKSIWVRNKDSLYYSAMDRDYCWTVSNISELIRLFS